MAITEADIQTRLRALVDPNTGKDFVSGKAIRKIHVDGANVDRRRPARLSGEDAAREPAQADRRRGRGDARRGPGHRQHVAEDHVALGPARREARSRRQEHHRGGERQGRRRQVDDRGQPGARARGGRRAGRRARRRHLRAVAADDARHRRPAGIEGRQDAGAARGLRAAGDVDRLPDRSGHADGLARARWSRRRSSSCSRTPTGATSTTSSSTCRPAPATSSSRSRRRCRSPAR